MKIKTYHYILNTLLKVSPSFASSVLDDAIKKAGHTIGSISAGEMLKVLRSQVAPRLCKDKSFLTDSLSLASTCTIQTNKSDAITYAAGFFGSSFTKASSFDELYNLGLVQKVSEAAQTVIRDIQIKDEYYKVSISPIFNDDLSITGTISTITGLNLQREIDLEIINYSENLRSEIDARMQAEDELRESQSVLFYSSKLVALGEMATGIAHEINNPLASISLSIDLLKKLKSKNMLTDEKFSKLLKNQVKLIDRIKNTIFSMKKLSRPTSSDITIFEKVSLKSIIDDVLAISLEKFVVNDVELRYDRSKPDMTFYGQETQIAQVLINLINNSYEEVYDSYQEPWIEIDWNQTDSFCFIAVTDCGPGIPADLSNKIFNPFFSSKVSQGGTGLGLSISSKIIKAHGGDLYIDLEYPNTRFVISLPRKDL